MTNKIWWENIKPINVLTKLVRQLINSLYVFFIAANLVSSAERYYDLNIALEPAIVSYEHKISNWVNRKTNVSKYVALSIYFLY